MYVTLTLNTTFVHFAEFLDTELYESVFIPFHAEDNSLCSIEYEWKGELGSRLNFENRNLETRRGLLERHSSGRAGVWVRLQGESLSHITDKATVSFQIDTRDSECIRVTIDECFDELPDACPLTVKDRLSGILRRIAEVWPEVQPEIRDISLGLHPFVSSQEWERWQEILMETNDPALSISPSLPSSDAPLQEWGNFFNPPGRPGRHTSKEDIWAAVEVFIKGKDQNEVFREWVAKDAVERRDLLNARDSFKKTLRRLGKKLGKNE